MNADDAAPGGPTAPDGHEVGDALPENLDITQYVGPYTFPNVRRRRIAGTLEGMVALACLGGWLWTDNTGMLAGGLFLAAVAAWHWITAWDVRFNETDALVEASKAVGFPVGHASAQLAWRGFLSRPTWRILCYSADDPPSRRGQVALDAVDGEIIGVVAEDNPEDWSQFGQAAGVAEAPVHGPEAFDRVMADLRYPMAVVTAAHGDDRDGCLVGFLSQCSIGPARFTVWLSHANRTYDIARSADTLVVHLLADGDRDLAELFGGVSAWDRDKLAEVAWAPGPGGAPVLARCARWFAGRVVGRHATGDHTAFVLEPFAVACASGAWTQLDVQEVLDIDAGRDA